MKSHLSSQNPLEPRLAVPLQTPSSAGGYWLEHSVAKAWMMRKVDKFGSALQANRSRMRWQTTHILRLLGTQDFRSPRASHGQCRQHLVYCMTFFIGDPREVQGNPMRRTTSGTRGSSKVTPSTRPVLCADQGYSGHPDASSVAWFDRGQNPRRPRVRSPATERP